MRYYYNGYDPTQQQLQTTQRGLWLVFKWAFKGLVYTPLLITGYLCCTAFLDRKANGLLWFGITILFAFLLYIAIIAAKKILVSLKAKQNPLWLVLFIFCVAFTCIVPAYLIYAPLNYIVLELKGNKTVTILLVACFDLYVYFQYDFLNHKPPQK
jgi:hypothetical protein